MLLDHTCGAAKSTAALDQVLAVLLDAVDAAVLHRVLGLLLERAASVRQTAVLRAAIMELLAEDAFVERPAAAQLSTAPPSLAAKRAEAPSPTNTRWAELRPRMRALIECGVTEQEIADGIGIARSTLRRLLSRVKREPGQALIARTTAWLEAREKATSAAAPGEETDRLSPEQRDRLAFFLQHDAEGVRRAAGISRDVIDQAVAGEVPIDRAVIARLKEYLTAGCADGVFGRDHPNDQRLTCPCPSEALVRS